MNNEAKLEIEQTVAALQAMPAAIDKLVAGMARLSRQQGTLKTTGKESLDALRAMQAGIDGFGSGLSGIASAVQSMNTNLSSAMREMAATISAGLKRGLDESETVARRSGKETGEGYVKALKKAITEGKVVAPPILQAAVVTQADIKAGTALALREGLVTSGATLALAELEGAKAGNAYAKGLSSRLQGLSALKSKTGVANAVSELLAGITYTPVEPAKEPLATLASVLEAARAQTAAATKGTLNPYTPISGAKFGTRLTNAYNAADKADDAAALKAAKEKEAAHNNLTKAANGSKLALAENASGMKIWTGHANDAHSAARGLASGFGAMWLTWGNIVPLLAGAAVSHTIAGVVKQGAEVNHIMETMRVLTEQTTQETGKLNAQMLEMARTGPIGPKDIAEGMKQLALAGLSATQVASAIKDVSTLSVAGELDMKKASEALTGIGEAFNIDARGYSYISDVLSKAAAESRSSVESIADAMKAASVIHKQYGVTLEDTALGVSILNNLNIRGTAAGTALRNMYVDLAGRTSQARMELERLGIKVKDVNGDFLGFADVLKNVDAGLSKIGDPVARSRSLALIASERGGKPIVEGLSLLNKPADKPELYANKLAELEDKFLNFQGFAAMAAAALVSTAENQLKSVASSYQESLQEAFQTAEPYILSVSAKLREMFQSEGFQTGLQNLMFTVGRVIEVLLDWVDVIATVIKGFALYKIAQVGILVSTQAYTLAAASATSAMYAKETSVKLATRSAVVHTAATNAQTLGLQAGTMAAYAANLGFNTLAVGIATASAALRVFLAFAAPVISIGAALYSAYLMFGDAKNAAFDEAKDAQHFNSLKAYNAYMEKNTQRVLDNNEALRQNISLQDLQDQKEKDRLLTESREGTAAIQKERDIEQSRLDRAAAQAPEARKGYWQTSPLLKQLDQKLQASKDEENRQVANNLAAKMASEETRRLLKGKQTKLPKEYGNLGGPAEGTPAVLASHEAEHLSVLSQALDQQLTALHDHNAKVSSALADKHKNHLMSDAQFYVAKSIQDDAAYTAEKQAIKDRFDTEYAAVTSAQQRALGRLAPVDMTGKSDYDTQLAAMKYLQMSDADFNARYPKAADRAKAQGARSDLESLDRYSKTIGYKRDAALGKLEATNTLNQEQANNALAGSYRNIEISIEALDKQMIGHHAQVMGQQADSVVGSSFEQPWEKAAREQHKASIKKYADDIARQQETIDTANKKSQDNLKAALASGDFEAYVKALDERTQAITRLGAAQEKLDRTKAQSAVFASQEAGEAKKTAFKNEVASFQKELSTGVSGAIATAVFEGGARGGEQLRKFLEQMFIRKPFEIAIQMTMEDLFKGEAGKSVRGGLFNWAKGGFGTPGGGAGGGKSDATADEFGQVVEAQKEVSTGLMASLTALFSTTTPAAATASAANMTAASINMTAATTMMAAAAAIAAAASALAASAGASSIAAGGGLLSGGGAADYSFINEGGFADVGLAFASGGQANPYSVHRVNENGTELLSMGGKDYLMTGSQGATVTSVRDMPTGGATIQHSVTVNIDSRADQAQVHALVMGAVRQGNAQLVDQLQQAGALSR